ncbi:acetyl-CoA synthetase [Ectothiorhodospira haloalkaliphila]|uniref:Acetyl-CoA synthetase n=1 Tax=Ectothiorhodospira haloalkaliphila TaxID=421628 RepID=W8KR42_9GAMM|nr:MULTISPECIES: GNAT family N-acetyltransferase [Ectothiorhodospira]AHK78046.1 acetyl-CoA synthetase [Ectothiorhodospira haloalkaliphila]MCG5494283.1 bifunctional acetate--CoA ligase family protein/GNAT family N-acetyltransferase [Ectothiorhodospira variabilis]MCG5496448.1 bifunctional acetate--CoA ligase family protein/GNAT family N-acetyltransferase [Ectothiorhodospira variabilis]MCG5504050.1 bifunctional acetate--CoA ligase family protein/GNAT family N-acetyltransferase [Ectothiorhodospira 
MGPHFLNRIFAPRSIAVIGATERTNALGSLVFANLVDAGFKGELYAVNPKHDKVHGRRCYPDVEAIGRPVELAVVATPARTVPNVLRHCGEHGVRGAVVLSAGFSESGRAGKRLEEEIMEISREYDLRLIGPNCLGVMRPGRGLNATFSKNKALPGNLALVSQSGAICTAILDWAESQEIGFSAVASMGDASDVDFGDVLDYLALDRETRSILLYVEGIHNARRFMSGLRAAARMKPVIVIKSGRHAEGSRAAMSHTGSLVGADDVFDAALERAGGVRAMTIQQLFSAARILSSGYRVEGNRLAIITNAGGPGVMATDRAVELDVNMARFSTETMDKLNKALPEQWSHGNPVDILGDADAERFENAMTACLEDSGVDASIVMLTPQAMTDPLAVAEVTSRIAKKVKKPVLGCWMGDIQVREGRDHLTRERLPHFTTPEASVEGFAYLAAHKRNQRLLLQVPSPLSDRGRTDVHGARLIIEGALSEGRKLLSTLESKAVLSAFRIPVTQTMRANTAGEALVAAGTVGYPVAMKIDSPDITHKSDVQGVRLNIASAESVRSAFQTMVEDAQRLKPGARINGVTLERMHQSTYGRELMVGVLRDPVFGPVISFGSGGTSVEVIKDRAVALPPLNEVIIEGMIARTKVAKLLKEFRNMPAVDEQALEQVLLRVSEMVCELPEIQEMDINPLIADDRGLAAVDARITVNFPPVMPDRYAHMAIHPYPAHLVNQWQLPDGTNLTIRPIRPEDAKIEQEFVRNLSAESRYNRFMQAVHELTPQMLVRFTQIDYDREMALIAVQERPDGSELQVAVARYTANPDQQSCEFALAVADEWQGRGVGSHLMNELMDVARTRGLRTMEGDVLAQNTNMMALMHRLGFSSRNSREDEGIKLVTKRL